MSDHDGQYDYGYVPLPYQGEGEVQYFASMPYATRYTGEAALQYAPVGDRPSAPSCWPFGGSGGTDWRYTGDGGDADIETMREWLSGMDEQATHDHAEAWRRTGELLASTAATLHTRAAALDAAWQSQDASAVFLERVGATLYSLDEWAVIAGNNAAGLTMVADAVTAAKREIEPLYDEYVAVQAAERREREKDRSGILGSFDLGDINDPFTSGPDEGSRSAEEISREYHGKALPVVQPVADAYIDAQFWWMDQGRRFAGPLEYQAGTGSGGPSGTGGGLGSVPTIAGGPSALPPWAPSAGPQLSPGSGGLADFRPVPGVSGGGHLAGGLTPAPAPPPAAPGPLLPPGGTAPGGLLPPPVMPPMRPPSASQPPARPAPVLRPPATRPPALTPPSARPPTLAPRPPTLAPRPPTPAPRPPTATPPPVAPRPPALAPRPPAPPSARAPGLPPPTVRPAPVIRPPAMRPPAVPPSPARPAPAIRPPATTPPTLGPGRPPAPGGGVPRSPAGQPPPAARTPAPTLPGATRPVTPTVPGARPGPPGRAGTGPVRAAPPALPGATAGRGTTPPSTGRATVPGPRATPGPATPGPARPATPGTAARPAAPVTARPATPGTAARPATPGTAARPAAPGTTRPGTPGTAARTGPTGSQRPVPPAARSRAAREEEDRGLPPTGERDDSLWTVETPAGLIEAPPERPPAPQGTVITPADRTE